MSSLRLLSIFYLAVELHVVAKIDSVYKFPNNSHLARHFNLLTKIIHIS